MLDIADDIMTRRESNQSLLSDHVDTRPVIADEEIADRNTIVQLDPDHPGFRDREYRARRNQIAQLAVNYIPGDEIPDMREPKKLLSHVQEQAAKALAEKETRTAALAEANRTVISAVMV